MAIEENEKDGFSLFELIEWSMEHTKEIQSLDEEIRDRLSSFADSLDTMLHDPAYKQMVALLGLHVKFSVNMMEDKFIELEFGCPKSAMKYVVDKFDEKSA
ncbi:MAG: hypothetical protein J6Y78_09325 [Paludibacteraceae bacterium]|nr:hypothetical protein [Paludibacteraceae bacterium]